MQGTLTPLDYFPTKGLHGLHEYYPRHPSLAGRFELSPTNFSQVMRGTVL